MQSLGMVRDELVATIEKAARDLEVFVGAQEDVKSLRACVRSVQQILGVFRLLELKGASILADELLIATNKIEPNKNDRTSEKRLEVVSSTFFALITYIDYLQRSSNKNPVLLIPYINELRKLRREPMLPESYFFGANLSRRPKLPKIEPIVVSESEFKPLINRLRHMYQVGLLGILRDNQCERSLAIMRRTLVRMQRIGGSQKPLTLLWWMANLALATIERQKMELLETRKMLLNRIDRVIHQTQKVGISAYNAAPPKGLIKELLYILAISGYKSPAIEALSRFYALQPLGYTEKELAEERRSLKGPSVNTVRSLARVLRTELNSTKQVLELAEQGDQVIDDIDGLVDTLTKICETLAVIGLPGPSGVLRTEIERVGSWKDDNGETDDYELSEVAKTLIYLESTVAELERNTVPSKTLNAENESMQSEIVAQSELAQAESIVLQESEAGLSLTKRAISAYSDSDFDSGHIRNIAKTLNGVRGGMMMLRKERTASILASCVKFVDEVLMQPDQPPALQELLETFADAIISVEYYLNSVNNSSDADDSVLELAEESVAALGYPVSEAA